MHHDETSLLVTTDVSGRVEALMPPLYRQGSSVSPAATATS
ncbi:MAG TPA: hypothetical protein VEC09_04975 [Actinomycetota bacterium]|nr:hypothetical protein [Actinomycetota bacterium]